MQWLKIVEKALEDASLDSVSVSQTSVDKCVFTFKFEDGSTVVSPELSLPRGVGIESVENTSVTNVDEYTQNNIVFTMTDGEKMSCIVNAHKGARGEQGPKGDKGATTVYRHTIGCGYPGYLALRIELLCSNSSAINTSDIFCDVINSGRYLLGSSYIQLFSKNLFYFIYAINITTDNIVIDYIDADGEMGTYSIPKGDFSVYGDSFYSL